MTVTAKHLQTRRVNDYSLYQICWVCARHKLSLLSWISESSCIVTDLVHQSMTSSGIAHPILLVVLYYIYIQYVVNNPCIYDPSTGTYKLCITLKWQCWIIITPTSVPVWTTYYMKLTYTVYIVHGWRYRYAWCMHCTKHSKVVQILFSPSVSC